MNGLMMDTPLMVSALLRHAATYFPNKGVTSVENSGNIVRFTYPQIETRARELAGWLLSLGVKPGARVSTIAWNTHRHLELYYAISGIGAVCHTINPRLAVEDIAYVLRDAGAEIVFFDETFNTIIDALATTNSPVKTWVRLAEKQTKETNADNIFDYEEGLAKTTAINEWPVFEETRAAGLCYTSGTTGKPKGVLYSHRSTVLHAMGCNAPNVLDINENDIVLPVVPMFHVNAWGIPHVAPMAGANLVLPGAAMDGESLGTLMVQEKITFAAGVPTIWHGLIDYLDMSKTSLPHMDRCIVGGSALPESMIRYFEDEQGVAMYQGWGMTETSPICTISKLRSTDENKSRAEQISQKARQGTAVFPIEMKIIGENSETLPWDDHANGELLVKGPWISNAYFGVTDENILANGWFATGDIAKIDESGSMKITDRAKDIIKSGGEWISSIELENVAMSHEGVSQAAVIGINDPRWGERPLMVFVPTKKHPVNVDNLREYLLKKLPKWKVPDQYQVVQTLPLGATGKILKTELRLMVAEEYSL